MRRNSRAGAALPTVLAVTAVLALVFLTAIQAVHGLRAEAQSAVDQVRLRTDGLTLEAQLSYVIATSRVDRQALVPLPAPDQEDDDDPFATDFEALMDLSGPRVRLDGRPYAVTVGDRTYGLQVQDSAGLINVNYLDDVQRQAMLELLGVRPAEREILADRIADYIDADDLVRPQGAERDAYARAGLPGPANAWMLDPGEVRAVLGLEAAFSATKWRAMRDMFAADPTSRVVNVNTAPEPVLRVLFGLSPAQAQQAILAREAQPFITLDQFIETVGAPLVADAGRDDTLPSLRYHVRVVDRAAKQIRRFRVVATPADPQRPIWIDARSVSPLSGDELETSQDVQPFPIAQSASARSQRSVGAGQR